MQPSTRAEKSAESPGSSVVEEIEREVRGFDAEERRRLGLEAAPGHFRERNPHPFTTEVGARAA